jgi:hypothetical protein
MTGGSIATGGDGGGGGEGDGAGGGDVVRIAGGGSTPRPSFSGGLQAAPSNAANRSSSAANRRRISNIDGSGSGG